MQPQPNIKETVPFFRVSNMEASLRFYVDGLGFSITHKWIPKDRIMWCRLERGGGILMLQEHEPKEKLGIGVSVSFTCADALAIYHEITAKGIQTTEPFVGNNMWVVCLNDPDGYRLEFQSMTDVPEETKLSQWKP